jgi:hypothetical protein
MWLGLLDFMRCPADVAWPIRAIQQRMSERRVDSAFHRRHRLGPCRPARPIHEFLTPFPVAYFTGALVTDLVCWQMPDVMWERFSVWMITAGLVMSALVAIGAVIDLAAA